MTGQYVNIRGRVFLTIICVTTLVVSVSGDFIPELHISEEEIWENSNVTLTCICPKITIHSLSTWKFDNNTFSTSFVMTLQNKNCVIDGETKPFSVQNKCVDNTTFRLTLTSVRRQQSGYRWTCTCGIFNENNLSNPIVIAVNVPVLNTYLQVDSHNISKNTTLNILNSTKTYLTCSSTCARPEAKITWYIPGYNNNSNIHLSNTTSGLVCSQSTVYYTLTLKSRGHRVYCSASNKGKEQVYSSTITMNVLHPPRVGIMPNASTIEGKNFEITCSGVHGNPNITNYRWSNENNITISEEKDLVIRPVSRTNETFYTCTMKNKMNPTFRVPVDGQSSARFYLTVLYKPNITSMMYRTHFTKQVLELGQTVYIFEGESFNISCFANSKPDPRTSWTGPVTSHSHDLVVHDIKRNKNGTYICRSTNNMPFNNTTIIGISQANVNIDVLYPPSVGIMPNTSAIEGKDFKITCNGEPGNPKQTIFEWWNGNNALISDKKDLLIRDVLRSNEAYYTCAMMNKMESTVGQSVNGNSSTRFYLTVLYKPNITSVEFTVGLTSKVLVHGQTVFIIEHGSFNISCFANSKPEPVTLWRGTVQSQSHVLIVSNVRRNESGIYTCLSTNSMPFNNTNEIGKSQVNVTIVVLYPAIVNDIHDISIVEGSHLETLCPVVDGNPSNSTVAWSRLSDEDRWTNALLSIKNVSRADDTEYTCSVITKMNPTIGSSLLIERRKSFHLNVFFPSEIHNFTISTVGSGRSFKVNETQSIYFECISEANPTSDLKIKSPKGDTIIEVSQSNIVRHTLRNASFKDAGEYICTGRNNYTQDSPSQLKLILIIRSRPRPSSGDTSVKKVATGLNVDVTLPFSARNYLDEPNKTVFSWFKENVSISDNDNKYLIHTNDLQTNITIRNTTQKDLGLYKVNVENSAGMYTHYYELKATDKPERPTEFYIINDSITDTTVTLAWSPGFNGGFQQTFVIIYKMMHEDVWLNKSIKDNAAINMNYTLNDLSSMQVYEIEMFAKNNKGRSFHTERLHFKTKAPLTSHVKSQTDDKNGIIAGSISAVVVVLIVAVVVFFILRKRRNKSTDSLYQNVPFFGQKGNRKQSVNNETKKKRRNPTNETTFEEKSNRRKPSLNGEVKKRYNSETDEQAVECLQEVDDVPIILHERTEYCNSQDKIDKIDRITVAELYAYVLGNDDNLEAEYQKLPTGLQNPCTFARKPENIVLNRYNGIYPYDHSRVKISDQPEFFINACYIDGYRKKKAYIASLGPTSKTTSDFKTFWQMVWHERSNMIVMLTNLHEPSGMKCEKYWPNEGASRHYGDVTITNKTFEAFAEYTVRTFGVSKGKEHRLLTHLHYTAWPDKTVPEDVTSLLDLRKRMQDVPIIQKGPIIIHCSAGIGRTGTLIALDILIEEGLDKDSVNVFECVDNLRKQRVKMVQTLEQYIYIHKCLVNALSFDGETIGKEKIHEHFENKNDQQYSTLFQKLKLTVETDNKSEQKARLKNMKNSSKNRQEADVPGDRFIVFLNLTDGLEGSEYINAVYVNSFKRKDHFIVAQSPLRNTVTDFVSMIFQEDCSCIATMEDLDEPGMTVGTYLPEMNKKAIFGHFQVSSSKLEETSAYIIRKIKIKYTNKNADGEKCFYHFQYKNWTTGSKTPGNVADFVQFICEVDEYANELGEDRSRVVVHCLKANERSCLFCAVAIIIEKLKVEGKVNVLNVIRHLRTRRRTAIVSKEQLKFCYEAASAYIKQYKY